MPSLGKENPRLIYCSVTGFGQTGPYAARAGYDLMAQGMGGIMDLTGAPDGEPQRAGVPVADIFTGIYSVVGILAALTERERTGRGCHVDTALVDSQVGVLANQALNYLVSGQVPKRIGNAHPNIVPYQVFPVADGHIIIATGNDNQFAKLCAVLGEPAIADEPRYRVNSDRLKNREELIARLSALTASWSRAALLEKLESVQVPAGPINPLDQVFSDPQVVHRGMRIDRPSRGGQGRYDPGGAHTYHHRRQTHGGRAALPAARRAYVGSLARNRRGLRPTPLNYCARSAAGVFRWPFLGQSAIARPQPHKEDAGV